MQRLCASHDDPFLLQQRATMLLHQQAQRFHRGDAEGCQLGQQLADIGIVAIVVAARMHGQHHLADDGNRERSLVRACTGTLACLLHV